MADKQNNIHYRNTTNTTHLIHILFDQKKTKIYYLHYLFDFLLYFNFLIILFTKHSFREIVQHNG